MSAPRARAIALAVLAAACAACSSGGRPATAGSPPEIRIATLPALGAVRLARLLTTEPLVAADWDGRPSYRVARSATESADGRVLTFELRANVRFHTGERLTAARARELLLTRTALMRHVSSIDTAGDDRLVISLQRPRALRIVDMSEYTISDERNVQVRTGPFRVASLGAKVALEPFPEYYRGRPTVARVEIEEYPTHRAAWTALMRGEINFLHELSREAIDFVQAGGDIRAYPLLRAYYVAVGFNVRHPVLRRREVRVALNEAIDRAEIIQKGMRGQGEVAEGPFWPYHWAYSPAPQLPDANLRAANLRLEAAGLPVRTGGAARMPSRFTFTCLVPEGDTRFERIALLVQRQLFAAGVDMRILPLPHRELEARLMAGRFDAFLYEMISGRTLSWVYTFWRSPAPGATPLLASGYSSADAALDRMRLAGTDAEVRIAVADVMRIMREDPPALFLVWPHDARAAERSIAIPYEPQQDIFGTLWQATSATERAENRP